MDPEHNEDLVQINGPIGHLFWTLAQFSVYSHICLVKILLREICGNFEIDGGSIRLFILLSYRMCIVLLLLSKLEFFVKNVSS